MCARTSVIGNEREDDGRGAPKEFSGRRSSRRRRRSTTWNARRHVRSHRSFCATLAHPNRIRRRPRRPFTKLLANFQSAPRAVSNPHTRAKLCHPGTRVGARVVVIVVLPRYFFLNYAGRFFSLSYIIPFRSRFISRYYDRRKAYSRISFRSRGS